MANANKEDALASLHQHTGWRFLKEGMRKKVNSLEKQYRSVDPNNSVEIARIQAQINILETFMDRPKRYFEQRQKNHKED